MITNDQNVLNQYVCSTGAVACRIHPARNAPHARAINQPVGITPMRYGVAMAAMIPEIAPGANCAAELSGETCRTCWMN